jgi:stage II sporulation protein GA (sporulation sigma-E factor processing peptidase)
MFSWTVKGMTSSYEAFFMINFVMNTLVIAAVARSRGTARWHRVLLSATMGAVYAVAMQGEVFSLLQALPSRLLLPFALSAIAFRADEAADVFKNGVLLLLGTVLSGGIQQLLLRNINGDAALWFFLTALAAPMALPPILSVRARRMEQTRVVLEMTTDRGGVRFPALIDTGNRLREPLSGRPVVIVEEARLQKILPEGFDSARAMRRLPPGFRLVRYGALGNSGTNAMVCFRPKDVFASFGRERMRAPEIWVAVYPGKMPGSECALAPTVIGAIQTASGSAGKRKIMRTERRMNR